MVNRTSKLSGWQLTIGFYIVGYVLWVAYAMYWGWQEGVQPYLGFVAWQALLYGPLWPIMLIARITGMVVATV